MGVPQEKFSLLTDDFMCDAEHLRLGSRMHFSNMSLVRNIRSFPVSCRYYIRKMGIRTHKSRTGGKDHQAKGKYHI